MNKVLEGGRVPVKVWADDLDDLSESQLTNMSRLPFIYKWLAAMPDAHGGIGACVGSVIPTEKAIIPAAVGVDIGCGMMAVSTNLTSADMTEKVCKQIHDLVWREIPLGPGGAYQDTFKGSTHNRGEFSDGGREESFDDLFVEAKLLEKTVPHASGLVQKAWRQYGSLGGGNHFIEICLDERDRVWVMLHSGSRGVGNIVGRHFIAAAQKEMERYFISLPDKDLAYLVEGSVLFKSYIRSMQWCQSYAEGNRNVMMDAVLAAFYEVFDGRKEVVSWDTAVNCHHNYTERESHFGKNVWVSRKGAIRAREGDLGIIPGSMGAKSFIVRGKGNQESFHSCSHGAGRKMSRKQARAQYTQDDLHSAMQGIVCDVREQIVDEIPQAYKDIDRVMHNQSDLVEIQHTLRQIVNIKGD